MLATRSGNDLSLAALSLVASRWVGCALRTVDWGRPPHNGAQCAPYVDYSAEDRDDLTPALSLGGTRCRCATVTGWDWHRVARVSGLIYCLDALTPALSLSTLKGIKERGTRCRCATCCSGAWHFIA